MISSLTIALPRSVKDIELTSRDAAALLGLSEAHLFGLAYNEPKIGMYIRFTAFIRAKHLYYRMSAKEFIRVRQIVEGLADRIDDDGYSSAIEEALVDSLAKLNLPVPRRGTCSSTGCSFTQGTIRPGEPDYPAVLRLQLLKRA